MAGLSEAVAFVDGMGKFGKISAKLFPIMRGVRTIMSFDAGYDGFPGIRRLPSAEG